MPTQPVIVPTNPDTLKLHQWIDHHTDEIVASLQAALRIPSVKGDPEPGAPFGAACREVLDQTLALAGRLGFRTKNVDGYAGHAEFGEGSEYVGALGHLDVVPEGDGWKYPPYGATLDEGYIYARGSADDKGPTFAALYGAKAVMDSGFPLRRRIRVIFGCDEESGFGCVHHYFEVAGEERPAVGFTPDSKFPLIFAEKGILNLVFQKAVGRPTSPDGLRIESVSGGLRPNMVPEYAEAILNGSADALAGAATMLDEYWDRNVTLVPSADRLKVVAQGKSAHGARPTLGDNAVARLAKALRLLKISESDGWLKWLAATADTTGQALGIDHKDDVVGPLTTNLGVLKTVEVDGEPHVQITYNIRYPVKWNSQALIEANRAIREKAGMDLVEVDDSPPLYVPLDQEPVATLWRVYRENTGDEVSQPDTMGGGTYARATPNTVAYGAAFPTSDDGPAHEPDERIAVATVVNAAKIYAQALYELAR